MHSGEDSDCLPSLADIEDWDAELSCRGRLFVPGAPWATAPRDGSSNYNTAASAYCCKMTAALHRSAGSVRANCPFTGIVLFL